MTDSLFQPDWTGPLIQRLRSNLGRITTAALARLIDVNPRRLNTCQREYGRLWHGDDLSVKLTALADARAHEARMPLAAWLYGSAYADALLCDTDRCFRANDVMDLLAMPRYALDVSARDGHIFAHMHCGKKIRYYNSDNVMHHPRFDRDRMLRILDCIRSLG